MIESEEIDNQSLVESDIEDTKDEGDIVKMFPTNIKASPSNEGNELTSYLLDNM